MGEQAAILNVLLAAVKDLQARVAKLEAALKAQTDNKKAGQDDN
jgi:outer membrane murein-binding lipoprotein Lpp